MYTLAYTQNKRISFKITMHRNQRYLSKLDSNLSRNMIDGTALHSFHPLPLS